MKSNKGFTLIELLAVIVILAIIALIATPIILDVIDTAKKGAKESSALGYIDAVEKQLMISQLDNKLVIPAGNYTISTLTTLGVEVKGEKPTDESTLTLNDKGAVTATQFEYTDGGYYVSYAGGKATASKDAISALTTGLCTYTSGNTAVSCPVAGA